MADSTMLYSISQLVVPLLALLAHQPGT